MNVVDLERFVRTRFRGRLAAGKHPPGDQACALECLSAYLGIPWTDSPDATRTFDLRALNDIPVMAEVRAKHLIPVLAAYSGWLDWPEERRQAVGRRLIVGTVNSLIAGLPGLPAEIVDQCRRATTVTESWAAAKAAEAVRVAVRVVAPMWAAENETIRASRMVAWAVRMWGGEWAAVAKAAQAAAEAAAAIAETWTAAEAAREAIFILACEIWLAATV